MQITSSTTCTVVKFPAKINNNLFFLLIFEFCIISGNDTVFVLTGGTDCIAIGRYLVKFLKMKV